MAEVVAVCCSPRHSFGKVPLDAIRLLAGLGVEGDAHCGRTVQHRSRVAADPTQPNLRQVHLIHAELHDELRAAGFDVASTANHLALTRASSVSTGALLYSRIFARRLSGVASPDMTTYRMLRRRC